MTGPLPRTDIPEVSVMTFRLLPKDVQFFDLFIADGENLQAAATRLVEMLQVYDRLDERIAEIQALEKRGDDIDREISQRLEDAFITPFDREDIHDLTVQLDDVVDGIQATAETFLIYGITAPTEESKRLAEILLGQADALIAALRNLDGLKGVDVHLVKVHDLEHQRRHAVTSRRGDRSSGRTTTRSTSSSGATSIARWKRPSMRPRTPPRPSSGCTTRRRSRPGALRSSVGSAAAIRGHPTATATGHGGVCRPVPLGAARVPGRWWCGVAQLQPPDGVGQPDRAQRTGRGPVGDEDRPPDMEGLAFERGGEAVTRADRLELAADRLDVAAEGRLGPGGIGDRGAADLPQELQSIQRQRPAGRRRWRGSGMAGRWEEYLDRLEGEPVDRRPVAGPRPSRRIGIGRAGDDRHGPILGGRP